MPATWPPRTVDPEVFWPLHEAALCSAAVWVRWPVSTKSSRGVRGPAGGRGVCARTEPVGEPGRSRRFQEADREGARAAVFR